MGLKKATIIDGKEFSSRTNQSLLPNVKLIVEKIGRPPALAVILVGEDTASHVYVRNKVKQTKDAGMVSIEHQLSAETSEKTLLSLIDTLNKNDQIVLGNGTASVVGAQCADIKKGIRNKQL